MARSRTTRAAVVAVVVGVLAPLLPAVAGAQEEASAGAIAGPYTFSSLGETGRPGDHVTSVSADGAWTTFSPGTLGESDDDNDTLYLQSTTSSERVVVADHGPDVWVRTAPRCARVSGDGSTVVFTTSGEGLPAEVPAEVRDEEWGFVLDVATEAVVALPAPDPAYKGGHWNDAVCTLDVSHDGTRVLFSLWESVFLAELGEGDPVVRHLLSGAGPAPRIEHAELDADGTRMLVARETRVRHPDEPERSIHVFDLGAELLEVWRTPEDGRERFGATMSEDGTVVAWNEGRPETGWGYGLHDLTSGQDRFAQDGSGASWGADDLTLAADGSALYAALGHRIVRYDVGDETFSVAVDTSALAAPDQPCPVFCSLYISDLAVSADATTIAFLLEGASMRDIDGGETPLFELIVGRIDDTGPPTWPAGAQLRTLGAGATFATVAWDAAVDDVAVASYEVSVDGEPVREVPATELEVLLTGLTPAHTHQVEVVPVDGAGGRGPALAGSVTTTAPAALAALHASPRPDGTVELRWDPADTIGTYQVVRTLDGTSAAVGTTDETTFVDEGVPAASDVDYHVQALRDSIAVPHTVTVTVATPELVAPDVTWATTRLRGGYLALGAEITITAVGQPHRTAAALVEGTDIEGAPVGLPVGLTEVSPGIYRGAVPDLAGVRVVEVVSATLADGAGHTATGEVSWTTLPAPVSGALALTIDADDDTAGARVEVSSPSLLWSEQQVLADEREIVLPAPPRADIRIVLRRPDGSPALDVSPLGLAAGQVTSAPLEYLHASTVVVQVVDPEGQPLADIDVDVRSPGAPNATSGTTGADGLVTSSGWTNRRAVAISIASTVVPLLESIPTVVELGPGENTVTVEAPVVPDGSVSGSVTLNGVPMAGYEMTLTQVAGGASIARRTTTDEDGRFALTGVHGDATVSVVSPDRKLRSSQDLVLSGSPADASFELSSMLYRDFVALRVLVRHPGSEDWEEQDVSDRATTWREFTLRTFALDDRAVSVGGPDADGLRGTQGSPGSRFRLCAVLPEDAGGVASCTEPMTHTGTEQIHEAEIRLDLPSAVETRLVDEGGTPATGRWSARASNGETTLSYHGVGSFVRLTLPAGGTWDLTFSGAGTEVEQRTVTFDGRGVVVLPDIELVPRGAFHGASSSVTALVPSVAPGGRTRLRVQYRTVAALQDAELNVSLPAGWSVPERGVSVQTGRPIDFGADDPRRVTVELGDLDAGATGLYYVTLDASVEARAGATVLLPVIVHSGDERHPVGVATIEIASEVTIEAPAHVARTTVELQGSAPTGSLVTIAEDGLVLGVALASEGRWRTTLELPDRPLLWEHHLTASIELDDRVVEADAYVTFDPDRPRITHARLHHAGLEKWFSVGDQVARFSHLFHEGFPTVLQLYFDRPEQVSNVRVAVGREVAPAFASEGVFTATIPVSGDRLGGIYVDYDSSRAPVDVEDPRWRAESELDRIRPLLPAGLRDVAVDEASVVHDNRADGYGLRFSAATPGLAGAAGGSPALEIDLEISEAAGFTPTAEDRDLAEAVGMPVYGIDIDYSSGPGGLSGRLTYVYHPGAGAAARMGPGNVRPMAIVVPVRTVVNFAFSGITNGESAISALKGGGKYARIQALYDRLDELESCIRYGEFYREEIDIALSVAYKADVLSGVITVASAVAAPATFGLGTVAIWAIGFAVDKAYSHALDKQIADLERRLEEQAEMDCDDDLGPSWPHYIGQPVWIHDPSGFVFEAVEDNRLEGVTATVLYAPTPDGPWEVWDAEWFGQDNPQTTGEDGRYAWDVPVGFWQVRYEKEGYATGFSDVLEVLPPHFDVDVGLHPIDAPGVVDISAPGHVELRFSQYMATDWVAGNVEVTDADGVPVPGTVAPLEPATTPTGDPVATAFRFVPDEPLTEPTDLVVSVRAAARNHAGRPMEADVSQAITAPATPGDDGPGEPGDAEPGPGPSDPDPDPDDPDDPDGAVPAAPDTRRFCGPPARSSFPDVSYNVAHIACLAEAGITTGHADGTFRPGARLTRGQMASFLVRLADLVVELGRGDGVPTVPPPGGDRFDDVDPASPHADAIHRLARIGVTTGTTVGRFDPGSPVTRAQMAAFLDRLHAYLQGAGFDAEGRDHFTDDDRHVLEAAINAIATVGIAQGTGAGRFEPNRPVTRSQMASFAVRHLAVLEQRGAIRALR